MLSEADKNILKDKNFQQLVGVRRKVSWSFLLILLGLYLTFGLLSVYSPDTLARPVFTDGVVPVGIVMGYAILATTFSFTLLYVWIANHYFEPLIRKIKAGAQR